MAKFCGNCGAKLENDAKVCSQCGFLVDGTSANIFGRKTANPEKKKKVKTVVKLIVVLAVLVVVVSTALNIVSKYTGYNGLLRKVMTAYEAYDIDTLVSLSSDVYYYDNIYYYDDDYVEYYFEDVVGSTLDSFESSVGHSYQLSFEINETYTLSERKTKEALEEIEYTYPDFDVGIIEEIVVSDITVAAKQGSKLVNRELNIIMSKESGKWRLLYIE